MSAYLLGLDMTDIVERLRTEVSELKQRLSQAGDAIELQEAEQRGYVRGSNEAADEIERLRHLIATNPEGRFDTSGEIERLRAALQEIADGDAYHDGTAHFMALARRALGAVNEREED